jgi:hypothetical protein
LNPVFDCTEFSLMRTWVLFLLVVFSTVCGFSLMESGKLSQTAHEKTSELPDLTGEDEDESKPAQISQIILPNQFISKPQPDCLPSALTQHSLDLFAPPPESGFPV